MKDLELTFTEISKMIEFRKNKAYRKVNEELISLYWDFGKYISEKINDTNWGDKIVAPLVRQISWTNNILILGSTKSIEEKEFYLKMCIKNNYSKIKFQGDNMFKK